MSDVVIRVNNLSKQYHLGQDSQARYRTLRDTLAQVAKSPLGLLRRGGGRRSSPAMIWALRDVTLEVKRGEVLGVIGRNGAGKSTLLKILSRVTMPTKGTVDLYGRVGSLLEVGTGFHPELTGQENIYLNGAILGMHREEIRRKFDEIVEFAEIEKFIDTPVKFYSSGMYMRLAFSVAAHLEPEILLVDEVLAVGDAVFQKKALGKMGEVSKGGRTVLFVSHNLDAVSSLTRRGIVLRSGGVSFDGPTDQAIQHYRKSFGGPEQMTRFVDLNKKVGLVQAQVITSGVNGIHHYGEPLEFEFEISLNRQLGSFEFAFQVLNEHFMPVINPRWIDLDRQYANQDRAVLRCRLPQPRLYMGQYTLRTFLGDRSSNQHLETVESICDFEVTMDGVKTTGTWLPGACAYIDDTQWDLDHPVSPLGA